MGGEGAHGASGTGGAGDLRAEYEAIRQEAALIDLSPCGVVRVQGGDATDWLTRLFTKEVEYLSFETSAMGLFLDGDGAVVDVATVYRTEHDFLVVSSPGRADRLLEHLQTQAADDDEVTVSAADDLAVVAIEGPRTWAVAEALLDVSLTGLPFQGVRATKFGGKPLIGARTGWTGEFGLQFLMPPSMRDDFVAAAGRHCRDAGLAALELTMLEIRQPVPARELVDGATLVEAGWNWLVDLDKDDFLGRDAVEGSMMEPSVQTVCFRSPATDPLDGAVVATSDREVGRVVWSLAHPTLGETLGLARLDAEIAVAGLDLVARVDGAEAPVRTASSPMVTPTSWGMTATPSSE